MLSSSICRIGLALLFLSVPLTLQHYVTDVEPSYGPVAGGTLITITGSGLASNSIISIMYGAYNGSTNTFQRNDTMMVVLTPRVDVPGSLPITVTFAKSGQAIGQINFTFRVNPIVNDIYPRNHIASGGTILTVTGQNLDTSKDPEFTAIVLVTVDVTQSYLGWNKNQSTLCTVVNSTMLTCILPAVTNLLPAPFAALLHADATSNNTYPYASDEITTSSPTSPTSSPSTSSPSSSPRRSTPTITSVTTPTPSYIPVTPTNGTASPPSGTVTPNGTAAARKRRSVSRYFVDIPLLPKRFTGRYPHDLPKEHLPSVRGRHAYKTHAKRQRFITRFNAVKSLFGEHLGNKSATERRKYVSRPEQRSHKDNERHLLNRYRLESVARKRRYIIDHLSASKSRSSRRKRDVTYSAFLGPNGQDRADVYVGLRFDGYTKYQNLSQAFPDKPFGFFPPPTITALTNIIDFNPATQNIIPIAGRDFTRGAQLEDYVVTIGNSTCVDVSLTDNELDCSPQKSEPPLVAADSSFCQQQTHNVVVNVGYLRFEYGCLWYTGDTVNLGLIVGLTVGLGVSLLAGITILIVCLLIRGQHASKHAKTKTDNAELDNIRPPPSSSDLNLLPVTSLRSTGKPPTKTARPTENHAYPVGDLSPGEKPLYLEPQEGPSKQIVFYEGGKEIHLNEGFSASRDDANYLELYQDQYCSVTNKYLELI